MTNDERNPKFKTRKVTGRVEKTSRHSDLEIPSSFVIRDSGLKHHRCHDYRFLTQRWREIARTAGLRLQRLTRAGGYEVFFLRSKALQERNGIYLSAGIHGDEAGSTEALVTWAERNAGHLNGLPLLILPCLNPWGIVNNCRYAESGDDLNRSFHRDEIPLVAALKKAIDGLHFSVSLMLHEDYDGQGLYVYEIEKDPPFWGEALIERARSIIPIEGRTEVDGHKAAAGLVRRRMNHKRFARIGYPEAAWLHLYHSDRTFTVETPSEFGIEHRVEAHVAIIDECVQQALKLK
jgi:protein MpaA